MAMMPVDYILIGIIVLSTLFSLLRGFVKEAISLGSWILAIWISLSFAAQFSTLLPSSIESDASRIALSYLILFIVTLMAGALVSYLARQIIQTVGLSVFDRVLGMAFGLARGLLIISALVMLGNLLGLPETSWWQESVLLLRFQDLAFWVQTYFPENVQHAVANDTAL